MNETVELYFDGELKTCTVTIDRNGEFLCEAEDGSFAKFPKDVDLEKAVATHNAYNDKEVEIIPDVVYGKVTTFDKDGNEVK